MFRLLSLALWGFFMVFPLHAESYSHTITPTVAAWGQTLEYTVESPRNESVERLQSTTVHFPSGEALEVTGNWTEYRLSPEGAQRIDGFTLRALQPGTWKLKSALVEQAGVLEPSPELTFQVRPPPSQIPQSTWVAILGCSFLLAGGLVLLRQKNAEDLLSEEASAGEDPASKDPLAPLREARVRGEARDFYVSLYAVLRAQVREATGRSPRDPTGLAQCARDAGLAEVHAACLRELAMRCERVVFGGEEEDISSLNDAYRSAEAVLSALAGQAKEEES